MEPGDDIIDVLYRCREPQYADRIHIQTSNHSNHNRYNKSREDPVAGPKLQSSLSPLQVERRRPAREPTRWSTPQTYTGDPGGAGGSNQTRYPVSWSHQGTYSQGPSGNYSQGPSGNYSKGPSGNFSPLPAHHLFNGTQDPVRGAFNRYDVYGGTGRVGYNNTPLPERKASFCRGLSQPDFYANRESPLPRSRSSFENRNDQKPKLNSPVENSLTNKAQPENQTKFTRREYDPYSYQGSLYIDEEPIYVPRSVLADIVNKNEDDLVRRRHPPEDLIVLPSGARQKRTRIFSESVTGTPSETMEGVRRRATSARAGAAEGTALQDSKAKHKRTEKQDFRRLLNLEMLNTILGLTVMIYLAYKYSYYLHQLHENELWFSEITELEREISFRTEQGLYYSYFKQLVTAPSIAQGLSDLRLDNRTESNNTINIIQRFNVHQEIILSVLYHLLNLNLRPILFYTYFVFSLQGVFLSALYLTAWSLSGTWLSGVLTVVYVIMNRFDVTRVTFTVPLREHFSLPFIFLQFYTTGQYLREENMLQLIRIYLYGVLYTLTWQFAQFVSLLQTLTLFGLATLGLLNKDLVCKLLATMFASILTVWYLQFYQPMLIISLVTSLIPIAILSLQSEVEGGKGVVKNLMLSAIRAIVALLITCGLNTILKLLLGQYSDNHIFKFIFNKIWRDHSDFESQLYLCNEAFQWLDSATYFRLIFSSILPLYLIYTVVCLISYISTLTIRWSKDPSTETNEKTRPGERTLRPSQTKPTVHLLVPNGSVAHQAGDTSSLSSEVPVAPMFDVQTRPDLCFHLGQSLVLGTLAVSTLRMKCFWSPYLCVLSSVGIADPDLWNVFLTKVCGLRSQSLVSGLKSLVLLTIILYLGIKQKAVIDSELEDLREFYDPDTVDLMQWISQNTNQDDAVSGSMQLMAGVKLCTGRTITNHPHFEDQLLRDRTRELYQMYGKMDPQTVFDILIKYNASYIVLEDSICLVHRDRCSTTDIMDLVNKQIPEDGVQDPPYLTQSQHPRFCDEVRYDTAPYRTLFTRVFENKTFRVYKLNKQQT